MRRHQGFTLIEIAIVLVIVGLLLGGVIKGQEFLNQAKTRAVAKDLDSLGAAVIAYQDRYKALPGDDKPGSRWSGSVGEGNRDGQWAGEFNSKTDSDETRLVWRHLRLAGFLNGDGSSHEQALHGAGGILGLQLNAGTVSVAGVSSSEQSGPVACASNLNGKTAAALDGQLDDGLVNKGSLRGYLQAGNVSADGGSNPTKQASATAYAENDGSLYTVCRSL
jgi:prepilin-type N-terminal cleavage/methylation domain-containing protein